MSSTSTLSEQIFEYRYTGKDPAALQGLAAASALTATELNYLSGAVAANSGTSKALITGTSGAVTIAGTLTLGATAITATGAQINASAAGLIGVVTIPDATPYTVLVADSGKQHIIADQTSNLTINLPAAAAGLNYHFIGGASAAEAQNWIIVAPAGAFVKGGLAFADNDAGAGADDTGDRGGQGLEGIAR